jgi:hypothetical protein
MTSLSKNERDRSGQAALIMDISAFEYKEDLCTTRKERKKLEVDAFLLFIHHYSNTQKVTDGSVLVVVGQVIICVVGHLFEFISQTTDTIQQFQPIVFIIFHIHYSIFKKKEPRIEKELTGRQNRTYK